MHPLLETKGWILNLLLLMFQNCYDIYNKVEAKYTVSRVEDLRNNVVNSTVFYKNHANSNFCQLKLSRLILLNSFRGHIQHCINFVP